MDPRPPGLLIPDALWSRRPRRHPSIATGVPADTAGSPWRHARHVPTARRRGCSSSTAWLPGGASWEGPTCWEHDVVIVHLQRLGPWATFCRQWRPLCCYVRDEYDNLPSGHPALRPWSETVFVSRDEEMDAEEARLRFALLATASGTRHGHGLEAVRSAILRLRDVADDGLVVRKFTPESFLIVLSSHQPM